MSRSASTDSCLQTTPRLSELFSMLRQLRRILRGQGNGGIHSLPSISKMRESISENYGPGVVNEEVLLTSLTG